ncbi:iron-containing alcohol dehydrogenase [Geoglobus acetivorans]|uniref:Iron-containing alcohol dehydrogenase n=1 Tax=Geoglobus acetivorans TaxID=565033 RepID=A0ABZ3H3L1_GEOAI|nr:iron-containing alcohol dehydrogenase [Geoglobus acetivorans]
MFEFSCVRVIFGCDTINRLPDEIRKSGGKRVAIVCGKAVKSTAERICNLINESDIACELWSEIKAEPEIDVVDSFLDSCRFDTVVGIGGGSTLDVAKLSAAVGNSGKKASDFLRKPLPGRNAGLILCPTTAGTGSEVTKLAVFRLGDRDVKHVFDDPSLYADVAIVDPKLTLSAPPAVTTSSGLDAICHAVEAYTSLLSNPLSDMLAEKAIEKGVRALREAYASGKNLEARIEMSYAALLAGIAFDKAGTSLGHALGYAHAFIHGSPHGKSVGMTQPYVLQYNAIANMEKHARIAALLGERVDSLAPRDAAFLAGIGFVKLLDDLDIPANLIDAGVGEDDVGEIVKRIFMSEKHISRNPRAVRKEEMYELVRKAIHGELYGLKNN